MRAHFIFPKRPKLPMQTPFDLPPLGMIQAAACVPDGVEVGATDENVAPVDLEGDYDLVGISILLSCQAPRAYELAAHFRSRGKTVVMGGVHVTLYPEEAAEHADAVVIGEAEGQVQALVKDILDGKLKKAYRNELRCDMKGIPSPRRDLYDKKAHYTHKGWELADLLQSSRGCRLDCDGCCDPFRNGRHIARPVEDVLSDAASCSDLIFMVDNSLEQDESYQKELFSALKGLGKTWFSHPISPKPELLDAAREAGWLYVYHAIWTISDNIRDRVRMYRDHGIVVQGSIILGLDHHSEDYIMRFFDFLEEIELDLAEFTILTPFPSTSLAERLEREGRIVERDWSRYNGADVVFKPKSIGPERLQELYFEGWKRFHEKESQVMRTVRLLLGAANASPERRKRLLRRGGGG